MRRCVGCEAPLADSHVGLCPVCNGSVSCVVSSSTSQRPMRDIAASVDEAVAALKQTTAKLDELVVALTSIAKKIDAMMSRLFRSEETPDMMS
jgi:hypothetical protein